jgi:hypothetical protein
MVNPDKLTLAVMLKIPKLPFPLTVSPDGPGPLMVRFFETLSVPDVSWIVEAVGRAKTIASPLVAFANAARRLPGPLSAVVVTGMVLGKSRVSSCSNRGRDSNRGRLGLNSIERQ